MGSMVELMVTSKRAFIKDDHPRLLLPVSQSLWWAPADPHLNRKPFILVQSSVESLFLSSGFWCAQIFVCALQDWILCFPQCCRSPIVKSYWSLRSSSLGIPSLFLGSPGREAWCGVQNLHNSEKTSLVLLLSSLQVTHQQVWNLILSWLHPSYHFSVVSSLSLDVEYLFVVGSSVLLLMVIQQLVVILVLSQKEMLSFLNCNRQHGQWGKFGKIATLSFQNNFSFLSYATPHRTILFSLLIIPALFFSSPPFSQERWFRSRKNEDLWLRNKCV